MNVDTIIFFLLGIGSVASALLMVTRRSPLMGLLCLVVNFFFLAVLYLTLRAQFIAIIQILVYAGAIMVLFLFVIMLLKLGDEQQLKETFGLKKVVALVLCLAMGAQFILSFWMSGNRTFTTLHPAAADLGTVEAIGRSLFTKYVFPFEAVSILLLAAIVGAVVLAKKRFQ